MQIKTLVFGLNSHGDSDCYFCIVECNSFEFTNALHFNVAVEAARENSYEPQSGEFFVLDETDFLYKQLGLEEKFVWDTGTILLCSPF